MTRRGWLMGLVPALAATAAMAAQQPPAPPSEAAQKIAACEGEKFEFKAGEPRPTKITLCSDKGATKDDLVRMFESAADKVQQLDKLPADRKAALVAQLKAKISEVRGGNPAAIELPRPRVMPEIGPKPEYAQLPPMPAPVRAPVDVQSSLVPAVVLSNPRLTLECLTPGEVGSGGPCVNLARDTLLTVRAGETLPAGTSLRFVRRGDVRAELALAQMRKGQSRRIKLPLEVCSGVVSSEIEIQVLRRAGTAAAGQVVDTRGPYQLRC